MTEDQTLSHLKVSSVFLLLPNKSQTCNVQSQKIFSLPPRTSPLCRFLPYAPDAYAKDSVILSCPVWNCPYEQGQRTSYASKVCLKWACSWFVWFHWWNSLLSLLRHLNTAHWRTLKNEYTLLVCTSSFSVGVGTAWNQVLYDLMQGISLINRFSHFRHNNSKSLHCSYFHIKTPVLRHTSWVIQGPLATEM